MPEFRNPYHFVPLGSGAPPNSVSIGDLKGDWKANDNAPNITHDRYVDETYSGRISCKVTVETPLICGNRQEERSNWTKLIHPFELEPDKPALPGSSLRGMLSSLAEAATHSTLRVLKGDVLSFRVGFRDSPKLSALGLVVPGTNPGELRLRPLSLPTLTKNENNIYVIPHNYVPLFPKPALKVYLDPPYKCFNSWNGADLKNASMDANGQLTPYYGMKLKGIPLAGPLRELEDWQRYPSRSRSQYLIGRQPINPSVVPWGPNSANEGYTRGIFRALGIGTTEREPFFTRTTKKHEFFIPYTPEMEAWPSFKIAPEAIDRFHELADQRTEEDQRLPFEPLGTCRGGSDSKIRLKPGDVVYFIPDQMGNETVITEISFSAIWRRRAETSEGKGADSRTFFRAVSPDLLPFPGRGGNLRGQLTMAEQLFGTVEVRSKDDRDNTPAFALASRVRVSYSSIFSGSTENETPYVTWEKLAGEPAVKTVRDLGKPDLPLKNLASPKPPSPALYFRPKNFTDNLPGAINKSELNPEHHSPQGRKFYLRRRGQPSSADIFIHLGNLTHERIGRMHQSVHRFVKQGATCEFHLDFDNLSKLELGLLIYILKPTEGFRHQIGHGKPLGLGQIKLTIEKTVLVDRKNRYARDSLDGNRSNSSVELDRLEDLKDFFKDWAENRGLAEVLTSLELLGTPPTDNIPVHYPQVPGPQPNSAAFEVEHFKWFAQNDGEPVQYRQYLRPLNGQTSLPTLRREAAPPVTVPPRHCAPPSQPQQTANPLRNKITSGRDCVGKTLEFTVLSIDRSKKPTKVKFVLDVGVDLKLEGSLSRPNDLQNLLTQKPDLKEGDKVTLYVHQYQTNFQLHLRSP